MRCAHACVGDIELANNEKNCTHKNFKTILYIFSISGPLNSLKNPTFYFLLFAPTNNNFIKILLHILSKFLCTLKTKIKENRSLEGESP